MIRFCHFETAQTDVLVTYFAGLGEATTTRYAPHGFDKASVLEVHQDSRQFAYLAIDEATSNIIAYFLIRQGFTPSDYTRYEKYGVILNRETDYTFAPSVADAWQNSGIGSQLFAFMLADLEKRNFQRIVLWGGVQATNERAVHFYEKHGFQHFGSFEHNGMNYDMMLEHILEIA